MRITTLLGLMASIVSSAVLAQGVTTINPESVQFSPYQHKDLPPALLKRIRATTDVFEKIDGLSYEQAVDLYRRDVNPEENLVLWEEMVRAYLLYCKSRCSTALERQDVYRALLLRSAFEEPEAVARVQPKALTLNEVRAVVKLYRLPAKPIEVVKVK